MFDPGMSTFFCGTESIYYLSVLYIIMAVAQN